MRIVVGVEAVGGAAGPLALVRALSPSAEHDTLVATVTPWSPRHALLGSAYAVTVHQDAWDVLSAAREDAGTLPVCVREVVDRSVYRGLLRTAVDQHADLVVLGRRNQVGRALAERLASRSPCPVASVPRDWRADTPAFGRIAVLVERGRPGLDALHAAARLAEACDSGLRLLGAVPVPASVELARRRDPSMLAPVYEQARSQLDAVLDAVDPRVPVQTMVRVGAPSEIARDLTAGVDLIVLTAPTRPAISRALARRLARRAACPLVFVPTHT